MKSYIEDYERILGEIDGAKDRLKLIEAQVNAEFGIDKAQFKKIATALYKDNLAELIESSESLAELGRGAL